MVSKAFQVLSGKYLLFRALARHANKKPIDAQQRAAYDRHGSDPEDRYAGIANRSSGFATSPFGGGGGGPRFADELSPEDLFNMFFGGGGGMGGGPFGNNGPSMLSGF